MNSNLYSTKDLENLSELRLELVSALKEREEIKDNISPLRDEKNSYNSQIEECEKRYEELNEKGKSISLEEAEEMADLVNNIRNCRIEKAKIEEKILEFGTKLKEANSKKEEIENKIDGLNNKVQENLVQTNKKVKGVVKVNGIKKLFENAKVNIEKCAIISTKKKSEISLKRIFNKNEDKKVENLSTELIDKINNSSFIIKVRELNDAINLAKEEFEKRLNDELKIKDIEKQCDEYDKEQEISDNLNEETKLEFIEKDTPISLDNNELSKESTTGLRLSTDEEMDKKLEERNKENSLNLMETNLKLKDNDSPIIREKQEALETAKNYLNNEPDVKIQNEIKQEIDARQKELDEEVKKENDKLNNNEIKDQNPFTVDLKEEKIVPDNQIGNISVNLFETNTPIAPKEEYIKPTVQFPPKNNFTTESELINNVNTVVNETMKEKKDDSAIVEQFKNNFEEIQRKAFERANAKRNQTSTATRVKLRDRIEPTFIENGSIKHIIEVVNGKVMDVKSEKDYLELKKFANEQIKQNVSSKQELLAAQHAVNNIFEQAKEMQTGKTL